MDLRGLNQPEEEYTAQHPGESRISDERDRDIKREGGSPKLADATATGMGVRPFAALVFDFHHIAPSPIASIIQRKWAG